ncbi:hypothetical protein HYH03_011375 [Edaphochlamys debaryana]|uniref:Uncharacterized protein n=1 Tax=Edaphochlamys debaryana TaxID=47281 RepID=A0A835XXK6_9CHLO|nr:hypothetical protein HYH03_011375 [Edaphochlamys debaryana]|eukprot:KAG2490251.1 hypothetical protein HYH03_011375 [Edaphochlamys debaryana]
MAYRIVTTNTDVPRLRLLRRLGLPWDENGAFSSAVSPGLDLDTLRWMILEGCPAEWAEAKIKAEGRLQSGDVRAAAVLAWIEEEQAAAA